MANDHVENLERALAVARDLRRDLAAQEDLDMNDLAELGDLQRTIEAIERAIEEERKLAIDKEARRTLSLLAPKRDPYAPEDDDPE